MCTDHVHHWFMVIRRDRRLSMLISDDEWAMLQALAEREGITASDWVRMTVRRAFGPATKTKTTKSLAEVGADAYNAIRDIREASKKTKKK